MLLFSFVFFSLITHIRFSLLENNLHQNVAQKPSSENQVQGILAAQVGQRPSCEWRLKSAAPGGLPADPVSRGRPPGFFGISASSSPSPRGAIPGGLWFTRRHTPRAACLLSNSATRPRYRSPGGGFPQTVA
jgi:hypothetical protein